MMRKSCRTEFIRRFALAERHDETTRLCDAFGHGFSVALVRIVRLVVHILYLSCSCNNFLEDDTLQQ
jgi:hypothetical protein